MKFTVIATVTGLMASGILAAPFKPALTNIKTIVHPVIVHEIVNATAQNTTSPPRDSHSQPFVSDTLLPREDAEAPAAEEPEKEKKEGTDVCFDGCIKGHAIMIIPCIVKCTIHM
ncbi:hypothetical protein B0J11DRAFT_590906 [Dendryphion nanum]|uniref:Uncharacterized protein n=1 Tax=Dendryphion nanum TaxID=256645 RepID=A0A9P9DJR9_9PLEO|nr:hypothetical protein B0J11DRAFT_590906 [Dendryphion nanum]